MNLFSSFYAEFEQLPARHQKCVELLKKFHQDLQAWIDAGRPAPTKHNDFANIYGLCGNLTKWSNRVGLTVVTDAALHRLLKVLFLEAGLDAEFPFNDGKVDQYRKEENHQAFYLNPKRLAWIKEHAK